ncbi:Na+/Pi-cotransporter [Roseovarius litorisediminis]|uniref:Na+/Pi-cotransporter n=2 Tax=Roseovarius litorisediminis TaxID=1312363 RepID=A0A1Y5T7B4_9RHOB|nr:Na+/Pi-cotransporter [Roseovarius litorisediminis]
MFFLHIAGAAALLIWAVRLVRTGVERAFAVQLRLWLRRSAKNRALAAFTGTTSAMLLQSSTAVAILVSNFVSAKTIGIAGGLAILLGADVGSALVAQVLLVRAEFLVPLLLLAGTAMFLRAEERKLRQTGRILIGLGLIFVSLDMIRAATAPMMDSDNVVHVLQYLGRDTLTAFAIGAIFAWLVHSSVAAVLLFVTLVMQGVMPVTAAASMVLGANLGGAMIAYALTLSASINARRMIVSNLVLRGGGAALLLVCLTFFVSSLDWLGSTGMRQVINLHLVFNLGLALIAVPFAPLIARIAETLMTAPADPVEGLGRISALDPTALGTPERALSCASRELIRMGETVEQMLRSVISIYDKWDDTTAAAIQSQDKAVRRMHHETKLYLAKLNRGALEEEASQRSMDLSTSAANLEAASDIIARKMVGLAKHLNSGGVAFSTQGWEEICDFHDRVLANTQLALDVIITQNPETARELVAAKERVRAVETLLQQQHLGRLQKGMVESIETSNIHQDTLRALKQANAFVAMIAHPILSDTGDLLSSRLTDEPATEG